jgi:hypothetical protein
MVSVFPHLVWKTLSFKSHNFNRLSFFCRPDTVVLHCILFAYLFVMFYSVFLFLDMFSLRNFTKFFSPNNDLQLMIYSCSCQEPEVLPAYDHFQILNVNFFQQWWIQMEGSVLMLTKFQKKASLTQF